MTKSCVKSPAAQETTAAVLLIVELYTEGSINTQNGTRVTVETTTFKKRKDDIIGVTLKVTHKMAGGEKGKPEEVRYNFVKMTGQWPLLVIWTKT